MSEGFDFKKEYDSIKYELPDFEKLDKEFEITSIQDPNRKFLVRAIRRRINEKLAFFIRILDQVLHPNTGSAISIHESKFFNDQDKQDILNIMRALMRLDREGLKLDVNPDEKTEAEYIKKIFSKYQDIKEKVKKVNITMEEAWSKEEEKKVSETYFG